MQFARITSHTFPALAALAIGLASPALAQDTPEADAADSSTGMSETAAGDMTITADMIDPAQPFGEIDVTEAGATAEESQTFFDGLSAEQQSEIKARCVVILDPVHQDRYAEEEATVLCRNLSEAGLVDEGPADTTGMDTEATGDAAASDTAEDAPDEPAEEAEADD